MTRYKYSWICWAVCDLWRINGGCWSSWPGLETPQTQASQQRSAKGIWGLVQILWIFIYAKMHGVGDAMALLVGHRTWDLQVVGSSPGWAPLRWASYWHLCASVAKQYILIAAKGVICLAGKVTVGLMESNGSLPPKCHPRADCQEAGISSVSHARNRVWDFFTF